MIIINIIMTKGSTAILLECKFGCCCMLVQLFLKVTCSFITDIVRAEEKPFVNQRS